MRRIGTAVLASLLPVLTAGCLSFSIEGSKDNLPHAIINVHRLEAGRSTLRDALHRLGPPDLILRVGEIDRLYYVAWDNLHFKMSISLPVPVPGRSISTDGFILGLGSEELRLARLDFDRQGILRTVQSGDFTNTSHGEYFAIDKRIVETFLEDRARALGLIEDDEDDEDIYDPKK